jgi:hypothetical protein
VGGGSLNTGGGFPGDQSIPETAVTQTTLRSKYRLNSILEFGCGPVRETIQSYGPFPGILPASALSFVPRAGYGETGYACDGIQYRFDVVGPTGPLVLGESIRAVSPPEVIEPLYS